MGGPECLLVKQVLDIWKAGEDSKGQLRYCCVIFLMTLLIGLV